MSVLLSDWSDKNFEVSNQLATWWPWAGEKIFFEFRPFSGSAAILAHFMAEAKRMPARCFFEIFFVLSFSTMYKVKHMWNSAPPFSVYLRNQTFPVFPFLADRYQNLLNTVVSCQTVALLGLVSAKPMPNLSSRYLTGPFQNHLWINDWIYFQ